MENQQNQVYEETAHENNLWDKFTEDVDRSDKEP